VKRLIAAFPDNLRLKCAAQNVKILLNKKISVVDQYGQEETFEHVIFACHADEAIKILQNPTPDQSSLMGAFRYQDNQIVLHSDVSFMPKRKKCWASWIYLSETREDKSQAVSLSYWMNNLQNLDPDLPLFVTLNPGREPDPSLVYNRHVFAHPIFDGPAINAQTKMNTIQGQNNIWFCGAYQRYGFHEDGLLSAVNVAKSMGASVPWE
jgi:predicted NAD/FAD-binding protein